MLHIRRRRKRNDTYENNRRTHNEHPQNNVNTRMAQ